jgi:hypothetical protein
MKYGVGNRVVFVGIASLLVILFLPIGVLSVARASTVSIPEIQSNAYPSGWSMYAGEEVTVSGVVIATYYDGYVVAEAPGPWGAIFVYSIANGPDIGDEVQLTGTVAEYYGMTEIKDITDFSLISSGNAVVPTPVNVSDVMQEQYESVLISLSDLTVLFVSEYDEWVVSDGTPDYAICDIRSDYVYFPEVGDHVDSVTGILFYTYGAFMLEPRFTKDIVGEVIPHYVLHGHVVTMDDERDVVMNAYVEILGDEIVAIHDSRPQNLPVIEVGGLIFPGLIDPHNHPGYNVLGPVPFQQQFQDRYEWQADPLNAAFSAQLNSIWDYGGYDAQYLNSWKLAEVRALTAGTTSIQGSNCNGWWHPYARQGIGIDNVERFPARVYHSTFPLSEGLSFWYAKSQEYWDRFIIHLAEGVNPEALAEFYMLQATGMLNSRVTIIHGVALGPNQWTAMATAGANLVWSPQSNLYLYGQTADIPGALAAGVNVALGPDWTESGSRNVLDELRVADQVDNEQWGDVISPLQLAEFVTRNAAKALGSEHFIGQIVPGYRANLTVIPGSPNKPYEALLRAEPCQVKLTIVDGMPKYGNSDIMAKFDFVDDTETIYVGGAEKILSLAVNLNSISEANKPFSVVLSELEEAYGASEPKICAFAGLE